MLRDLFLVLLFSTAMTAQAQDAMTQLAGTGTQQWSVVGSSATDPCKTGDATYTFQAKPAQVVVKQCTGGTWKSSTEAVTNWSANGKSGIAFGGARYEVKSLPATAPA